MKRVNNNCVVTCILFLWIFATFWNIDKAFHIDDTGHLEIARWIEQNPIHPMRGWVNWSGSLEPISTLNQPHLYFYLMAGWAHFFGYSEVSMHLLMALFSLWAITAFYRLANVVHSEHAIHVTALFALSSAFVVAQNSMVDVPLLAVWIEFYYFLLNPHCGKSKNIIIASLLCSVALLIKYTSLVLVPALVLHILLTKKYKNIVWILIPIATLLLWSGFNLFDYGRIHILDRARESKTAYVYVINLLNWIVGLGAILPFSILIFVVEFVRSISYLQKVFWVILSAAALLPPVMVAASAATDFRSLNLVLLLSFFTSGLGVLYACYRAVKLETFLQGINSIQWMFVYWVISTLIFIVAFAPFMATRHVLLAIPAILLILFPIVAKTSISAKFYFPALAWTVLSTCLLAKADFWYSSIYKTMASTIAEELSSDGQIWFVGHWGWQWYAQQSGMRHLERNSQEPRRGDYLVVPLNVIGGDIPGQLDLLEIETKPIRREYWYQHFASINFYVSPGLPWGYSNGSMETFKTYRIIGVRY